jgi:hypothetical protein
MRLFCFSKVDAVDSWDDVRPFFESVQNDHDGPIAEVIHQLAIEEKAQVWGFDDGDVITGVVATEVIETARGKVCNIMTAIGGTPLAMQERMMDEIGKWALSLGCIAVRLQGRKGWLRRFPRLRQTGITAEWSLTKAH